MDQYQDVITGEAVSREHAYAMIPEGSQWTDRNSEITLAHAVEHSTGMKVVRQGLTPVDDPVPFVLSAMLSVKTKAGHAKAELGMGDEAAAIGVTGDTDTIAVEVRTGSLGSGAGTREVMQTDIAILSGQTGYVRDAVIIVGASPGIGTEELSELLDAAYARRYSTEAKESTSWHESDHQAMSRARATLALANGDVEGARCAILEELTQQYAVGPSNLEPKGRYRIEIDDRIAMAEVVKG